MYFFFHVIALDYCNDTFVWTEFLSLQNMGVWEAEAHREKFMILLLFCGKLWILSDCGFHSKISCLQLCVHLFDPDTQDATVLNLTLQKNCQLNELSVFEDHTGG